MKPIKLYHIPTFRSTRALWMYLELCLAYDKDTSVVPPLELFEFADVEKFRNDKPEWYLKINANGKIPTLIDDNVAPDWPFFESCALVFHLLDNYDKQARLLSRSDAAERTLFFNIAFYASGTLDNLVSTSSPIQRAEMKVKGGKANMRTVINPASRVAWKDICAPFLENLLSRNTDGPYVYGQRFSAIDVVLGHSLFGLDEKMASTTRGEGKSWLDPDTMPMLCKFQEALKARPARKMAYQSPSDWVDGFEAVVHLNQV